MIMDNLNSENIEVEKITISISAGKNFNGTAKLAKWGNVVMCHIAVEPGESFDITSDTIIFRLPDGYKPINGGVFPALGRVEGYWAGATYHNILLCPNASGEVMIRGSNQAISACKFLVSTFTYISA